MKSTENYRDELGKTLKDINLNNIQDVLYHLNRAFEKERNVFVFGNGGSASTASHLACDFQKGTMESTGKQFNVICLNDSIPIMTAWANDTDYADIFANQLSCLAKELDVVIAISGSGKSHNIINAVQKANDMGCITIGLTGMGGGELSGIVDLAIVVDSDNMQRIEDMHLIIGHMIYTDIMGWKKENEISN